MTATEAFCPVRLVGVFNFDFEMEVGLVVIRLDCACGSDAILFFATSFRLMLPMGFYLLVLLASVFSRFIAVGLGVFGAFVLLQSDGLAETFVLQIQKHRLLL